MTIITELIALYKSTDEKIENNIKFIKHCSQSDSEWDKEKIKELATENKCLIRKRCDIGEILWHSEIDVRHPTIIEVSEEKK
jgi:hypothetical protein